MTGPITTPGYNSGLLERALGICETVAAAIGGAMMLLTMILTTTDALLRYTINAPLTFNYYLTENYLMVGMLTLPLAWGFRNGGYIRIMALARVLPRTPRRLLLRAGLLISSVYIGALAWLANDYFIDAYRSGDVQMGVINWPVCWSWVWIPIGLGLLAIRLVVMALGSPRNLHFNPTEAGEDGV